MIFKNSFFLYLKGKKAFSPSLFAKCLSLSSQFEQPEKGSSLFS